jgi:hypothetical protein
LLLPLLLQLTLVLRGLLLLLQLRGCMCLVHLALAQGRAALHLRPWVL